MATTYKTLTNNDIATTRTLLHEAIPITGSIVSGTYLTSDHTVEENIKNYAHGMFQSVYDYPYLSSSANHIFDITCGYSPNSDLSSSGKTHSQHAKKINIYNQMAQLLMGYDSTGTIREFDADGDISAGGIKNRNAFFVNFARLLTKDEIKKGSFRLSLGTGSVRSGHGFVNQTEASNESCLLTLGDYGAQTSHKVNSPAGEYGILYTGSGDPHNHQHGVGLLFYQAGIAVISSSVFTRNPAMTGSNPWYHNEFCEFGTGDNHMASVTASLSGATIQHSVDGFRNRMVDISFNNTTELNSTIYFCRVNHNEFNYSANPSYLDSSKIRVKGNNPAAEPVSYITTIGLYSSDNELLAVAKLSEPLKKTPSNELTLRVRLDY